LQLGDRPLEVIDAQTQVLAELALLAEAGRQRELGVFAEDQRDAADEHAREPLRGHVAAEDHLGAEHLDPEILLGLAAAGGERHFDEAVGRGHDCLRLTR
jgi:hypothetical protein